MPTEPIDDSEPEDTNSITCSGCGDASPEDADECEHCGHSFASDDDNPYGGEGAQFQYR